MNRLAQAPTSFVAALYAAAAYMVLAPFVYELQRLWPLRPGDLDWRFGASGFILTAVTTPLIGLALAGLLAWLRGRAGPQRTVALVTLLFTVFVALVLGLFLADLGPTLRTVPANMGPVVKATALRSIVGAALAIGVLLVLGVGGWRASGRGEQSA